MIFEKKIIDIYRRKLIRRLDADGSIHYFEKEDFPGLLSDEVFFSSDKGQRLVGQFYYRNKKRTDRLVMLDHGMGCGHVGYMQEINLLTERGYTVFTYDHTGTRMSEGDNLGGLTQSLADLDYAFNFVRSLDEYKETEIAVIGHSWGGFSTMNISALHPDITHTVVLSPYISVRALHGQILQGLLSIYKDAVYKVEADSFPDYVDRNGIDSLRNSGVKALIIHSRDDDTCSFKKQFEVAQKALSDCPRVEFLALDGKRHYPNYTTEAAKYKSEYNATVKKLKRKKVLTTRDERVAFAMMQDWNKMTEQDMTVWERIFEFLEK